MKDRNDIEEITKVSKSAWRKELEKQSSRYHIIGAWIAIIFDPLFAITDFYNIPDEWLTLLVIRIFVSIITVSLLILRKKFEFSSYLLVAAPFILIALQNSYGYSLIGSEDLLGHSLNYIALLLGGALFILWEWQVSVIIVFVSTVTTTYFLNLNPELDLSEFMVRGGLLLGTVALFMIILIQFRYILTVREIKARLALQISNEKIRQQAEKIRDINENLEELVQKRTVDLKRKNEALEQYAFINAHKLRSPLASILGLTNLIGNMELNDEASEAFGHLQESADKLDEIIGSIRETIENADD
ncbi:MAG: histidine kinase dimerization/phospho-acceptor domain-containing protein [Bacteroidota bacterium]